MLEGFAGRMLAPLLDASLKSLLLLSVAGLALLCLRRASAALRHLVLLLTLGGVLCLPLLSAVLPPWRVALPSRPVAGAPAPPAPPSVPVMAAPLALPPVAHTPTPVAVLPDAPPLPAVHHTAFPWRTALVALWLAGAAVSLVSLLVGLVAVGRLERQCVCPSDDGLTALIHQCVGQLDLRRAVALRQVREDGLPVVPMTWGWRRPIVLLPSQAGAWPMERQHAVLLHELAHVRRGDWLWQTLGHLACALYWFHPGVWWLARRMRIESEAACDDVALSAGIPPSNYATHLVDISRSMIMVRQVSSTIAMTQRSGLERRLRDVLATNRCRTIVSTPTAVLVLMTALGSVGFLAAFSTSVQAQSLHAGTTPKRATAADDGLRGPVLTMRQETALLHLVDGRWVEGPREFFEEKTFDQHQVLRKWVFHTQKPGGRTVTLCDENGIPRSATEYLPDGTVYTTHVMKNDDQGRQVEWSGTHANGTSGASSRTVYDAKAGQMSYTAFGSRGEVTQTGTTRYNPQGNIVEEASHDASGKNTWRLIVTYDSQGRISEQKNYVNGVLTSRDVETRDLRHGIHTVLSYEGEPEPQLISGPTPALHYAKSPVRLTRKEVVVTGPEDAFGNHPRTVNYEWLARNGKLVPTSGIVWYRTFKYAAHDGRKS